MTEVSVARTETETRAETLREVYVEALAERCAELGSPLTAEERVGYEAKALMLYPDGGRS
jgi:hypothetical protein